MTANPNCLDSVCEEVQYPVAKHGIESWSAEFASQLHGGVLNTELKLTNRIVM